MTKATKALVPILLSLLLLVIGCAKKPPTITNISPNSGPSGGGTKITITGENFKEGATLTIAGKPVKDISIDPEGTRVTATTPGGPPGSQQVIAKNLKAKEDSAPATFTYDGLKVVSTEPADGAQVPWYPRLTQASATLSQPIEAGSASISIGGVTGEVSYDASTRTATFIASEPLPTGASHSVTVSGAKDAAGNVMSDYTFGFSIEEAVQVDWYTVQEGDTLPIIAAKPEVYEDEVKWKLILEANQDEFVSEDGKHGNDIILDRKNLIPGMVLYIPR
jgi:nucleoid-associated protein YgaU